MIDGERIYIAMTVADGRVLGVELATSAGAEELTTAYGVFKAEARDVEPEYAPRTTSVDNWAPTYKGWLSLFSLPVRLGGFLPGWLKIRSRGKLSDSFRELSRRSGTRITRRPGRASRNGCAGCSSGPDGGGYQRGSWSRLSSCAADRRNTPRRIPSRVAIGRATCWTGRYGR